ncbi:HDIG domain-containing protein [Coraliomargarita sp. SDUM461004]|uniref:HDIG domain-containing protein n=1 Tax=Thalassobacterium sedimentorum TaxID=3041258 RepID=A0ABU1AN57_9BACT|nr:HDIG domain-containing metalloprotein [Coraliomargarita sp. SDUM461004]MDQ8196226.1 HDIG domain-containing protein [Coraliomargarita sp. SDUM461004]
MVSFSKKNNSRKSLDSAKRKDGGRGKDSATTHFFETSKLIEIGLFLLFSALVIIICYLGQKPKGPRIILNQAAQSRIVSEFQFDYKSEVLTEAAAAATRAQVPPVFQRTFEPYEQFSQFINELNSAIAKNKIEHEAQGQDLLKEELLKTALNLIETHQLTLEPRTILELTTQITPKERSALFNDSLSVLKDIYTDGIYSASRSETADPHVTVIQLVDEEGRYNLPNARSLPDALVALRVRIDALSRDASTGRILFDIFREGLRPNLLYSAAGTNRAIKRAIDQLEPSIVSFKEGDTLIEPGAIITPAELERIAAYRKVELERNGNSLIFNKLFIERLILTTMLLITVYIYLKQGLRELHKRNRAIAITAVSILLNLLIIRIIMEIGESALINSRPSLSMLPYIAPYALAPIIVAVLVGGAPAVLSSLIIAVVFGIIQNNSVEFILIAFLSGVVGAYVSTNIRKRSKLVRSGLWAGATAAIAGAAVALLNGFSFNLVGQQTLVALIVGLLTGILAVGLLPIFEQLFKITTEITLLELTDFNHPLLRRMQMEAPGTYHHSLMVANLSENAAAAIGASPLLCRVCCFFHDIGKLVKPEYFTENQRDGINPHDEKNPSMSALVIKAHVKEGVEMARKNKLPRVIIDVIRQHHGTTLIQYFYHQAKEKAKETHLSTRAPFPEGSEKPKSKSKGKEEFKVDESTYRYDGPKPAFKESAIIFFADSVEAASRSLKKVTQPNVEELIDRIFKDRIEDGQLDNCPLTFHELDLIRKSFIYTVLNMLHARIEYPKSDAEKAKELEKENTEKNTESTPDANAKPGNQQPI